MPKSQTVWSNSAKNADRWVVAGKLATTWNNEANLPASYLYSNASLTYDSQVMTYNYVNAIPADQSNSKSPTAWAGESKNLSSWSNESTPQIGYIYDSPTLYNSSYAYDYTTISGNQSNNKNATAWSTT